ncbi:hypothetical protein EV646_10978 [Kribbella antiqua]|uniref:Allene oxide cyclase barrel-like domain-containing protein n=2 Tax=Kribbella antiqua TaxID=2512217 RepID=A0A4R2IKR4_9ACTN|nr:hypothetical protein EV646_10978 [Kribbella antiqua]
MLRIMRSFALLAVALASCLVAVQAAQAAPPVVPNGEPFEILSPAGEYCSFPLRISGESAAVVRPGSPNGDLIITGAVAVTVTNLATGESRSYNVSGPTFVDAQTGLQVFRGPALIGQPVSVNAEDTFLIITRGQWTFDPTTTAHSFRGRIAHDICAELG